jgi:glycosyltransferase involved in cell wall biosynthesis
VKVCHFVASVGLGRGDVFVDLANVLCESIDVVILAPEGARFKKSLNAKVELVEYKSRNSRVNPILLLELARLLKQIKPDLVHTHFAKATEIFCLLNRLLKLPWVATKHNPRKGRIYNKVDRVIAVSDGVAETVGHDDVTIIQNGIAPVNVPVVEESSVFKILAVGRLESIKAFDRLIEECSKLPFDFKLEIVGEGSQKDALIELTKQFGIREKVVFPGYRTDIPEIMQAANVIVVCSHSEGFGLVILEALFYGKVLISRKVGIATKILDDKFIVEDFEIACRLKDVYENYESYSRAFAVIRERRGSDYLLENTVNQHLEYYQAMLRSQLSD